MTTKEQNFVTMAKASLEVLSQNEDKWSGNNRMVKAVADLRATLTEIENRTKGGLASSTGATSQKQQAEDRGTALAVKIAKIVKVYAADQNDLVLKQKMSLTKNDFHKMQDNVLLAQFRLIQETAQPLLAALEDYGLTPKLLTDLGEQADLFQTLQSQPRTIITERKMHNATIPDLIKLLREDLHTADNLIGIFDDHDLENNFKNARKIIDRGIRHEPKGDAPTKPES